MVKNQFNFVAIGTDSAEEIQSYISNHPWPFDHVANAGEMIFTTFKHRWGYQQLLLWTNTVSLLVRLPVDFMMKGGRRCVSEN